MSASELRTPGQAGPGARLQPGADHGVSAAVAALAAILAAGWATDFRYPVRRLAGPDAAWKHTASAWLRHCQHSPTGTITVTFRDWWGPARLATTFNCSSLRR